MTDQLLVHQSRFNRRFLLVDLVRHQIKTVINQLKEIYIRLLKSFSPRELGNINYQFAQVSDSPLDQLNGAQAFVIADAVAQHGNTQSYAAERISNFMRDLRGCLAHRRQRFLSSQTALSFGSLLDIHKRQDLLARTIDRQRLRIKIKR